MLQQTQVKTVVPYYHRWLQRFPTVEDLARASEHEVLAAWQGLGYYRRARLLLAGAKQIVRDGWPTGHKGWLGVPGVGTYTAGAIASIVLVESVPAVDGNVERVHARLTASPQASKREVTQWSSELVLATSRPGELNQALMELGATICAPRQAQCTICPLEFLCLGKQSPNHFPTSTKHPTPTLLDRNVSVPVRQQHFGVRPIASGTWWAGMWEFPSTNEGLEIGRFHHTVTNHKITFTVHLNQEAGSLEDCQWMTYEEISGIPLPAPQKKALSMVLRKLAE